MKKLLLTGFICIFSIISYAQLSLNINDKFIYDVEAGGSNYNFTFKIKSLLPSFTFAWQMNNEDAGYGKVSITQAALATSKKMHNYFGSGDITLNNATSVVLSKAAYTDIIQKKKVTLFDGDKKFVFENPDETDFFYTINGEEKTTKAIYLSDANQNDIIVLKNEAYPIILKMNIGWTIKLNTVLPSTKTTTDLSLFIDKKITGAAFLWNKLDRSSFVTTEDLTAVGDNSGPSVYKEYFSHIEGLWVKTLNDTITDIIYYPLPLLHSYHTYYGGDITIPQLSSFNFNRAQAKVFVKTKFLQKSSYDTDIYQATGNTSMELYYHIPVKIKGGGFEFGIIDSNVPKLKQLLGFITFQKK